MISKITSNLNTSQQKQNQKAIPFSGALVVKDTFFKADTLNGLKEKALGYCGKNDIFTLEIENGLKKIKFKSAEGMPQVTRIIPDDDSVGFVERIMSGINERYVSHHK